MRQSTAGVAVAAALLVAACGNDSSGTSSSTTTSTSTSNGGPLAQAALPNLLLTPDDIDTLLHVRGTTSDPPITELTDNPAGRQNYTLPAECTYIFHPGAAPSYADSGDTAVLGYRDVAPTPTGAKAVETPELTQIVVLFPAPEQARAFFDASARRWPACANRQDTVPADATNPGLHWQVGAVSNANGMLTTTVTVDVTSNGTTTTMPCQRALTVRNNVAIDVNACRKDLADLGSTVANQIAGKVDKQ
ncbi:MULTISPECIES: sensor domain-containing protein [unclassified Mycobacterium]|nr:MULTISPECIES: sensor domain-containing protein [unclassified Mycobacterium]OBG70502.1 nuclease PIN [Mycobacterium sp. E1214]OBH26985.1 nuclease PIN [Mycobacterium sp. E1319]